MGLREVISVSVILGMVAVAGADRKPAKVGPGKAPASPAERPDPPDPADPQDPQDPATAALDTAAPAADTGDTEQVPPHIVGPRRVDLGNATAIDLPDEMVLLERAEAQALLRKGGDPADGVVAMVLKPGSTWRVFIEYDDAGYIDDSDADDLDADDLLESYRKGTSEQNTRRKALGNPELVVDSWSEPPRYERAQHQLVWGLAGHSTEGKFINFFTRILGRNGYLSIDLIDAPERIEASKKEALAILQATRFNPGSTYADHTSSDRSSGIGLRGLVLGGAGVAVASKLGLLAKLLLVFKKLFIVVIAGAGGLLRWLFRRKPRAADAIDATPPASGGSPPPDDVPPPEDMGPG